MADIKYTIDIDAQSSQRTVETLAKGVNEFNTALEDTTETGTSFGEAMTGLNQTLEVASKAFQVLGKGLSIAVEGLNRGADVNDVASAFETLSQKAGAVSQVLISDLRRAAGGTITDFELMADANQLLNAGLDPSLYDDVIQAARAYADQIGGDSTEAVNQLIEAIKRGDDRTLKQQQIFVDNRAELEKYAVSVGKAVEDIDELTQKEVIRGAITEAIIARTKELGEVQNDVADNTKAISIAFQNLVDDFVKTIASNEVLNEALRDLAAEFQRPETRQAIIDLATNLSKVLTAAINLGEIAIPKLISGFNFLTKPLQDSASFFSRLYKSISGEVNPALKEGRSFLYDYGSGLLQEKKNVDALAKPNKDHAADVAKISSQYEALTKRLKESQKEVKTESELILDSTRQIANLVNAQQDGTINAQQFGRAILEVQDAFVAAGFSAEQFQKIVARVKAEAAPASFGQSFLAGLLDFNVGDFKTTSDFQSVIGDGIGNAFRQTAIALEDGKIGKEEAKQLGAAIGGVIGTAIGLYFGYGNAAAGAAGGALGSLLGGFIGGLFDNETAGTKARKDVDKFFNEVFDAKRLTVIIGGQLQQLQSLTTNLFGDGSGGIFGELTHQGYREILTNGFVDAAPGLTGSAPDSNNPFDIFSSLPAIAQQAFQGIGKAFEELIGVADDVSGQVGVILALNLGGSINNLQLLIEATGRTAEELANAVQESFLSGTISAAEAYQALLGIQRAMEKGIPDGVGLVVEAFQNLEDAGTKGGRAAVDAIRDLASEAKEKGVTSLEAIQQELLASGKFTAEEVNRFFELLAQNGIDSIDELENASVDSIIAILAQLEQEGKLLTETAEKVKEVADAVEKIPNKTEKEVVFKVKVEFDQNAQSSQGQAAIGATGSNSVALTKYFQQGLS